MGRFKIMRNKSTSRKNTGWDYKGRILLKTTSEVIWNNKDMAALGVYIESIIDHWVKSISRIRVAKNIFVPKDYDKVN